MDKFINYLPEDWPKREITTDYGVCLKKKIKDKETLTFKDELVASKYAKSRRTYHYPFLVDGQHFGYAVPNR